MANNGYRLKTMEQEKNTNNTKWPFVIQIPTVVFLPVIMRWSTTPTNVLNASTDGKTLEEIGMLGAAYIFFISLPIGIIGKKYARKHPERLGKLAVPTKVLSIVNILAGAFEIGLLVYLFVAVVFGGLSA